MNMMLDDKNFYDTYGVTKEDAAELLIWRIEKLLSELKGVVAWNKQHSSQNLEDQSN